MLARCCSLLLIVALAFLAQPLAVAAPSLAHADCCPMISGGQGMCPACFADAGDHGPMAKCCSAISPILFVFSPAIFLHRMLVLGQIEMGNPVGVCRYDPPLIPPPKAV